MHCMVNKISRDEWKHNSVVANAIHDEKTEHKSMSLNKKNTKSSMGLK